MNVQVGNQKVNASGAVTYTVVCVVDNNVVFTATNSTTRQKVSVRTWNNMANVRN